jgi:hypothetical protein
LEWISWKSHFSKAAMNIFLCFRLVAIRGNTACCLSNYVINFLVINLRVKNEACYHGRLNLWTRLLSTK